MEKCAQCSINESKYLQYKVFISKFKNKNKKRTYLRFGFKLDPSKTCNNQIKEKQLINNPNTRIFRMLTNDDRQKIYF